MIRAVSDVSLNIVYGFSKSVFWHYGLYGVLRMELPDYAKYSVINHFVSLSYVYSSTQQPVNIQINHTGHANHPNETRPHLVQSSVRLGKKSIEDLCWDFGSSKIETPTSNQIILSAWKLLQNQSRNFRNVEINRNSNAIWPEIQRNTLLTESLSENICRKFSKT